MFVKFKFSFSYFVCVHEPRRVFALPSGHPLVSMLRGVCVRRLRRYCTQGGLSSKHRWRPEAVSSPSVTHYYCSHWLNAATGRRVSGSRVSLCPPLKKKVTYIKHNWDSSNYVSSSHYIFCFHVLINVTFLKWLSSLLEFCKIVPRGLFESHAVILLFVMHSLVILLITFILYLDMLRLMSVVCLSQIWLAELCLKWCAVFFFNGLWPTTTTIQE